MREARPPIPLAREGGPRRPGACEPRRDQSARRGAAAVGTGRRSRGAEREASRTGPAGSGTRTPPGGLWEGPRVRSPPRPARDAVRPESPVAWDRGAADAAMDEPWWDGRVASDVHSTLREKELKLPTFRAHSPLLKSRRFLVDILTLLSSHCQLCPAARHLAVYLLDHFLDRYNITTSKQLYTVAVSCLLLASKFEDREDHVPKLEQINSMRVLSNHSFTLTRQELLSAELLLLQAFRWNLGLPTPAHFLDYYLLASVSQKDHHCHSWPTACPRKTKECLKEYAHYFLEVTLQDHIFYKFQPSVVAAACVGAARICLQLFPYWTRDLQRISSYSLEHLSTCLEILLVAYDNVLKDAVTVKSQALAVVPSTPSTHSQVLFQAPAFPAVSQQAPLGLLPFQASGQDLCLAYRDSLQAHRSGDLLSGGTGSSLSTPYPTLQPLDVCPVPLPPSLRVQMSMATETRHSLATPYGSRYFTRSCTFPMDCFDK